MEKVRKTDVLFEPTTIILDWWKKDENLSFSLYEGRPISVCTGVINTNQYV